MELLLVLMLHPARLHHVGDVVEAPTGNDISGGSELESDVIQVWFSLSHGPTHPSEV